MKDELCLIMYRGPHDGLVHRINRRIELFENIFNKISIIIDGKPNGLNEGGNCSVHDINNKSFSLRDRYFLYGLLLYLYDNIKICKLLAKSKKDSEIIFVSGIPMVFPAMIFSKILDHKIITLSGGSAYLPYVQNTNNPIIKYLIKYSELMCYHAVDIIVAETPLAIEFMGLTSFKNKINYIGCLSFIDIHKFKIAVEYKNRKKNLIFIGNLIKSKGINELLEAFKIFSCKNEHNLIICGDGPLKDDILSWIDSNQLNDRIFLRGFVDENKISEILNDSILFILPSKTEGLPTVLLEAMASGTPVLVTPVGGVKDIVVDKINGYILTSDDPNVIAQEICNALKNENTRSIIENARQRIICDFSYDVMIDKWKGVF